MLYREIIAVCSEINTKPINTLCGQNVEMLRVKPGGTYSYQWAIKCSDADKYVRVDSGCHWLSVVSDERPFIGAVLT
jgi:hypothetical protein